MKREEEFLDKWLKEFGCLQTRGSGDDLSMICKDCTKAGKKNAFTSGCKNVQRSALVPRMSQVDHKSSAKLLWQKNFKAAITLSEHYDSSSPVTLSHNNNTNNFLGGGRVAKILVPTQNAWDPNLTRHVGTRTQSEKS